MPNPIKKRILNPIQTRLRHRQNQFPPHKLPFLISKNQREPPVIPRNNLFQIMSIINFPAQLLHKVIPHAFSQLRVPILNPLKSLIKPDQTVKNPIDRVPIPQNSIIPERVHKVLLRLRPELFLKQKINADLRQQIAVLLILSRVSIDIKPQLPESLPKLFQLLKGVIQADVKSCVEPVGEGFYEIPENILGYIRVEIVDFVHDREVNLVLIC